MNALDQLLLFRTDQNDLLYRLFDLNSKNTHEDLEREGNEYLSCISELVDRCEYYGFSGNLLHCFLAWHLAYHENAFSKACEIRGAVGGGINQIALHDCEILLQLFREDFSSLEGRTGLHLFSMIRSYEPAQSGRKRYNRRIRDRIRDLAVSLAGAKDASGFKKDLEKFYKEYGVGKFGLHKAFRIAHKGEQVLIVPITNIAHVQLEDLVGYEIPKQKLIENTEAFVAGRQANNCLLYGDIGTGKSSSIKGILNRYYDRGLRIIEIYKHEFRDLNAVISQIKDRNYRFIIYMDDLSFEEFETEYKYLKAVIEGGLEKKPENILIYATSNRRHLIRESYSDKEDVRQDMHASDTVQEKLSLFSRFGVSIYFGSPDKKEFQNIVSVLADRSGIEMPKEQLLLEANAWELKHGGLSGRTAQQFIDHILGTMQV